MDFFIALHIIPKLVFHSGNYEALQNVLDIYKTPNYFLNILFALNILMQGLSSIVFFIAAIYFWINPFISKAVIFAFSLSIALWAVFLIMEEIFIAYRFEATHFRLLIAELVSLIYVVVV